MAIEFIVVDGLYRRKSLATNILNTAINSIESTFKCRLEYIFIELDKNLSKKKPAFILESTRV